MAALALLPACGGDDGGGDEAGGAAPGATCVSGSRVEIGAAGASPTCLQVAAGATVTIANGRATAIEVRSAPHPTHGSCPEIDATPIIPPSGSVAVVMETLGTCSFHDHATGGALGTIQVGSSPGDASPYE